MEKKRDKVIRKLETHLRLTARRLLNFDTTEETLTYLTDSFLSQLNCDFVGVLFKENGLIYPKAWSGGLREVKEKLPIHVNQCSQKLFEQSLTYADQEASETCKLFELLEEAAVETWFTLPIKDGTNEYGICIVGFLDFTPLFDMNEIFDEFGKDVSVAISLSKQKELEKKKMMQMEWIMDNLNLDESVEKLVSKIVNLTGQETASDFVGIYLYNELENCFMLQSPTFGEMDKLKTIEVEEDYSLKNYFPFIDTAGFNQLTVTLTIKFRMIGVFHVEKRDNSIFTEADLQLIKLYRNHVASILENSFLHKNERELNNRLYHLLEIQQGLIRETIEEENFEGITTFLSEEFSTSVFLFDRFMFPITCQLTAEEKTDVENISELAAAELKNKKNRNTVLSVITDQGVRILIWPINGGDNLLGYLAIANWSDDLDNLTQLSLELVQNIYAIQFIKQKLVASTKEQVKESFINLLLVENIQDQESILEYANLFHWDIFKEHRVSVITFKYKEGVSLNDLDALSKKAKTAMIIEQLKAIVLSYDQGILAANVKNRLILFAPVTNDMNEKDYWHKLHRKIRSELQSDKIDYNIMIGIGAKSNKIEDYYNAYQKAIKTNNVISNQGYKPGIAFFEDLGSYTILHRLKDLPEVSMFMNNYLEELLALSTGNQMDLFNTLRVYLEHNGNVKYSAEELFIHRSSLLYRLKKIEDIFGATLTDPDLRFNLMLAFKLYDLNET